jgi:hypothetical protein
MSSLRPARQRRITTRSTKQRIAAARAALAAHHQFVPAHPIAGSDERHSDRHAYAVEVIHPGGDISRPPSVRGACRRRARHRDGAAEHDAVPPPPPPAALLSFVFVRGVAVGDAASRRPRAVSRRQPAWRHPGGDVCLANRDALPELRRYQDELAPGAASSMGFGEALGVLAGPPRFDGADGE